MPDFPALTKRDRNRTPDVGPAGVVPAEGVAGGDPAKPAAPTTTAAAPGMGGGGRAEPAVVALRDYRLRLTSSCSISSLVVITRALDWKPR